MKNYPNKRWQLQIQQMAYEDFFSHDVKNYLQSNDLFLLDQMLATETKPDKAVDFLFEKIPNLAQLLTEKEQQMVKKIIP